MGIIDYPGFGPIPVDELLTDGIESKCSACNNVPEDGLYWVDDDYFCERCADELIRELGPEAQKFAEANCRILCELPEYDAENEYRCTPDEYEAGMRESYTPNAYLCHSRHVCTNYDALIKGLSRDSLRARVWYDAIRCRIEDLLVEQMGKMESEGLEELLSQMEDMKLQREAGC